MAPIVPTSLIMQRSGPGVSGATLRPYSLAKARTSFTATGSAPWRRRYCGRVRRSLPLRLAALSGFLCLTRTETVIFVPNGAGLSLAAGAKADFSLPGRTVRFEPERGAMDFFCVFFAADFAVMGRFSKFGDEFVREPYACAGCERP